LIDASKYHLVIFKAQDARFEVRGSRFKVQGSRLLFPSMPWGWDLAVRKYRTYRYTNPNVMTNSRRSSFQVRLKALKTGRMASRSKQVVMILV